MCIVVDRPQPTNVHPQGLCLDKGYDYDEVRGILSEFGFTAHIRARGEEAKAIKREAGFKARSFVVERAHSWTLRFRHLLVRSRQKATELSGVPPFRLWLDRFSRCRVIRIGTKRITLSDECFIATREGERTERILTDQDG